MRISIRVMLIAMGMMTGVAGAPTEAGATKETAATAGGMFGRLGNAASSFKDRVNAAASGVRDGVTAAASTISSGVNAAKEAGNKIYDKGIAIANSNKAGSTGQNTVTFEGKTIDAPLVDIYNALESGNLPKVLAYAECVNGAMMLVIFSSVYCPEEVHAQYQALMSQIYELSQDEEKMRKNIAWTEKVTALTNKISELVGKLEASKAQLSKIYELQTFIDALKNLRNVLDKAKLASTKGLYFQQLSQDSVENMTHDFKLIKKCKESFAQQTFIRIVLNFQKIIPSIQEALDYYYKSVEQSAEPASATQSDSGDES